MKWHATDGERRTERVHFSAHVVMRIDTYRSLCGRWMPDDERWADQPADVTCETCRRVLKARVEIAARHKKTQNRAFDA